MPRLVAVLITGEHPGAIAEPLASPEGTPTPRIYAVLPARDGADPPARSVASARSIVSRGTLGAFSPTTAT
jgi:hypothetical protein